MGDKDPWECHKTLATLQASFVMPKLDITHSSWLGKSFLFIDVLRHNPALGPQTALSEASFRVSFCILSVMQYFQTVRTEKNTSLAAIA